MLSHKCAAKEILFTITLLEAVNVCPFVSSGQKVLLPPQEMVLERSKLSKTIECKN